MGGQRSGGVYNGDVNSCWISFSVAGEYFKALVRLPYNDLLVSLGLSTPVVFSAGSSGVLFCCSEEFTSFNVGHTGDKFTVGSRDELVSSKIKRLNNNKAVPSAAAAHIK